MQIAAMRRSDSTVCAGTSSRVRYCGRIAETSAKEDGKPEQAIPKIVEGRVNAFFKDNVLLEQPSVVDPKKSVTDVLAESGTNVRAFARFEPGQG
jgi:elongation factor Ts